jgi:predicted hotdog family 3-hydroxylacyl-ACP dehydratase
LDRQAIAARIPHAGAMCLLDRVISWDEQHIECAAFGGAMINGSPHPLAQDGKVPATAAIEYAAQAMALHGRLVQEQLQADKANKAVQAGGTGVTGEPGQETPRRGFLAALRSVRLHCRWLEAGEPALTVRAERFAGDAVQVLYDFEVRTTAPIAQGRAVVVLDAQARVGAPPGDATATTSTAGAIGSPLPEDRR